MAEPFYRVGEQRGPFIVTESTFEIIGDRTREYVKDSGGNYATTYGWNDDREYHQVCQRDSDVLVPYTVRHKLTEEGVPENASWVYVGNSPYDYWRVLCEWWKPRDFVVIEHDVKANPEILEEFENCSRLWCYGVYSNFRAQDVEAWKFGILGCTRFRTGIIQAVPKALKEMQWRYRDWHVLSTGLGRTLREHGFEPHLHGVVDHHRMMDLGGVAELMAS
jgi:hypothetical protein